MEGFSAADLYDNNNHSAGPMQAREQRVVCVMYIGK